MWREEKSKELNSFKQKFSSVSRVILSEWLTRPLLHLYEKFQSSQCYGNMNTQTDTVSVYSNEKNVL